jgi:hypothetical protein
MFLEFGCEKWTAMVIKVNTYWMCEECGFKYEDKSWAERCEAWCEEHKSCNLEITKHAVKVL